MPHLRKQPFHKHRPPADLRPDEEVFHCKITNEIFRDYEAFFERIILCNSLVWSCAITGRSGMTYQEAEECEEKARKHLATFQDCLQRPLLFLASLTHRGRLADLNDDVFLFAKDRFFIGETVDVLFGGERRPSKIVKVVAPTSATTKTNGDVIVIDEDSGSDADDKRELPPAENMMYIVHPSTGKNNRVMVKATQVSRKKGLYTRDKSKLFLKQHCESVNGLWTVKESIKRKMRLEEGKYEDFYGGPRPRFTVSPIKKKTAGKKAAEQLPAPAASTPKTSASKSKETTPTVTSKTSSPTEPMASLTPEERAALKEKERLEKVAERIAKQQEMKQKIEEEKQKRKEEREKEREKKREEKKQQMEKLKEWSKPREDMECDDLKPLPELKKLCTRVPTALFGDAMMVLEYLNSFKTVFDFKQFFPKGLSWGDLETALMGSDPQGPLCDLVQMLLCALFNLQEEEAEEFQAMEKEQTDDVEKKTLEDEQPEEEDRVSNNELIRSATMFAQFSQLTFGMPLKDTLLDQFTLTEVLRLHLMSAGARANSNNARFRYQQRGGYSSLDDPGLELRKQDPALLKKLQNGNIFDFSPEDKLRVVTTLVQQVTTYAAVRDIVEETYDKLRVKKYDLKLLQWAEVRRIREDQAFQYKRQMEERIKEREYKLKELARAEQIRQAKEQGQEPPTLPPLDDPPETAEEKVRRDAKEKQEEAKKRADYAKREMDAIQVIVDMQRTNALYPLGRDRHYRRYWLFPSMPAVMVEDYELFLNTADTNSAALEGESLEEMPTLIRQDELNTSSDKENDHSSLTCPTPRVNGVKSDDSGVISESEEAESRRKQKLVPRVLDMDKTVTELVTDKNTDVDTDTKPDRLTCESNKDVCSEKDTSKIASVSEERKSSIEEKCEVDRVDSPSNLELPRLDSSPLEHLLQSVQPKWYVVDSKECLQNIMASLNARGFRESALHAMLQDYAPYLNRTIDACPLDLLCPSSKTGEGETSKAHIHTRTSGPVRMEGTTHTDSASEAIELTLRDGLLDLEERIFVGSLGGLKVKDRAVWRTALEHGGYNPQTDEAPFCLIQSPKKETREDGKVNVPEEQVARDLSHALVQIARGVEPRFMKPPLGDSTEDKKKVLKEEKQDTPDKETRRRVVFERWEESILGGSSLSQVFLHLAALDKSITWDRAALMSRCRICRRKADPEKMLLCDKCDRGHHMYCLVPPMTKVPTGDWFCPNCRPKVPPPSPRKSRRRTFSEVEEEEEEEERLELQDTIEEEASDEEDMEQESEEEMAEEEEEEEVEEDSEEEEEENEDACAACREDGKLILCDVCPRSYHLHCARPVLKKVPKGKWMCQVCVGGGRAGKIMLSKPKVNTKNKDSKKETPKSQNSKGGSKSGKPGSRPGSRHETPRNSPTPTSSRVSKKYDALTQEITPKTSGQKSREVTPKNRETTPRSREVTPKIRGQVDKDWAPPKSAGREVTPKNRSQTDKDWVPPKSASREVTPKNRSQADKDWVPPKSASREVTPKNRSQADKDWAPKSGDKSAAPKSKRSSTSRLSTDGEFEISARQYTSSKRGNSKVQQMHVAQDFLQELIRHTDAWPFIQPVDKKLVPDYYKVIKKPMDLCTIRNKVHRFEYTAPEEILDDVRLIFANCIEYNARNTPEYRAGQTLTKFFDTRVRELGLDTDGSPAPPAKKQRR